ncbi:MAG: CDP-alcohol phosphatidyltransferase family protein [Vicinamibacterales bacterium]
MRTRHDLFDRYLRPLKDRALAPLSRLAGPRISPNVITGVGFVLGLGSAGAAYEGGRSLGLMLWLLNRLLDGLDGTQARTHGRSTAFGGYLDIVLDFVVYAAVPIGLVTGAGSARPLTISALLMLASFYINAASWMYLAAILEQRRQGVSATGEATTITMPSGLVGGTETVVFYVAFFLWPSSLTMLFTVMTTLVMLTVLQRLAWARRSL